MAASGEKPYRVYKGGRTKGKVPLPNRERAGRDKPERTTYRSGGGGGSGPGGVRRPKRGGTWEPLVSLVVLLVIWSVAAYLSVSSGVSAANKRLPAGTTSVLAKQNSLLLSSATNILMLGTDHSTNGQA